MDALALDFGPLIDDGEDEETEDHQGQAELDRKPQTAAARGAVPEPRPGLTKAVQKWLASLHVRRTLVTRAALRFRRCDRSTKIRGQSRDGRV